jgi:cytochrome c oxidase assembly protein subunit 15
METSLPRLRGMAVSARTFRRVALANVLWLFVIVASGASVRLTGSGLGCEHWPGCSAGSFVPENGFHGDMEFSNRVVSGVAVFLTFATWLVARFTPSLPVWARRVAGVAFLGTLAEAPLGAITVKYHLNPWLVGTHFLLSLVVLMLGMIVLLEAWGLRGDAVPLYVREAGVVVAAACAALLVTGALATAAGPHSGSIAVPRIGSFQPAVWLHVRATAVFGISFALLLGWLVWRRSRHVRWAYVVLGLLALQMAVGEIQYRWHPALPWWLVLVHVTLSAAVWAAAVTFVALLWRPRRGTRMA